MSETVRATREDIYTLSTQVLEHVGYGTDHRRAIAEMLTTCQFDDCQSHGLFRLFMCAHSMQSGQVDGQAAPRITSDSSAVVRADACGAISLLAVQAALPTLIERTRSLGVAVLKVTNCFHFSALWPELEQLADSGLAAMSMVPSHAWVAPAGGTRGALGTNPLAFAWPRPGPSPFAFDFATSAFARGEIELYQRAGKPLPEGVAIDRDGRPTTDPAEALAGAMLTFGGHKGSALSLMIELMAGPLIGDLTSLDSLEFAKGQPGAPYHGQIIVAFDPSRLGGANPAENVARAERLFTEVTDQGARLPSQRRHAARLRNTERGYAEVPKAIWDDAQALMA